MPVRSSNSSVLRWPVAPSVDRAVREWAAARAGGRPGVVRTGHAGSYARGDWGPGSDVDLIVIVYTRDEWERMRATGSRFAREVEREAIWVWPAGEAPPG